MRSRDKSEGKPRTPVARRPQMRAQSQSEAESLSTIPAWLPAVVYAFVTLVFFHEFILADGRLLGMDTLGAGYFGRNFFTQFVHTFKSFPLWDPLLYGGLPFIDGMHGDIFYPPSLAMFFLNAEQMWGWKMVLHIFLAGIFCFLWLRELGLSRGSAMLGGLIFMLGPDLISLVYPGGDGKLFVSALAPLAFLLTERAVRMGRARDYAAFALGIVLVMFTSHMQAAYFLVWGVTLYFIFRLVQHWKAGWTFGRLGAHLVAFALAGIMAVGAAAIQFLPPLDYLRNWSHRASRTEQARSPEAAYQYSTSYALNAEEIMALVIPEFVGDNAGTEKRSSDRYWGKNGFKLNSDYAGLLGLLLLPLLFVRRRRAHTWFFVALGTFALLYALGAATPLFRLFYLIPGVKLFRAPSIIIFLYGLSVATLAAFAFERAAEFARGPLDEQTPARRALWITVGFLGFLAVLATTGIFMSVWQAVFHPDMNTAQTQALSANMAAIKTGFWISFALAVLTALALEAWWRGRLTARAALIALCVIAFVDLHRAGRHFIRATVLMDEAADATTFIADESIDYLRGRQAAGEVFRVFDLSAISRFELPGYPPNVLAIHGLEQLAGHHGNEIGRYRELLGGDQPVRLAQGYELFDVTNTMYLVVPALVQVPGFTEVFRGSRSVVYQNPNVLPRAYLVGRAEVVPATGAVDHLLRPGFDYRKTALLEEPLPAGVAIEPDPQGSVRWTSRGGNEQTLTVTSDKPALLMVLDNYYHAWRAQVDGQDTPILRANHAFRAVPVPAGTHNVSFHYDTGYLNAAAIISAVILIALLLIAFGGAFIGRLRRGEA